MVAPPSPGPDAKEWEDENGLRVEIREHVTALVERYQDGVVNKAAFYNEGAIDSAISNALNTFESKFTPAPRSSSSNSIGMRIGPGKVVRIAPTLRDGTIKTISIIATLHALRQSSDLSAVDTYGLANDIRELLVVLSSAYERINDPEEERIFEAVALLQRRLEVVDHVALRDKDYSRAVAFKPPTLTEITEHLNMRKRGPWKRHIQVKLKELERREILVEHDGKWRVGR